MAAISFPSLTTIILGLMILCLAPPSAGVPSEELDRALSVLRFRGRALFANAIATSDLLFDLLSAESLTLLGPTDSMLFAVDMTRSLPFYIATLRLHTIPLRLSLSSFRSLPNASSVPTLLPSHHLLLTRPSSSSPDSIFLNGLPLLLPGLFYSRHLAVHGLPAVLPFRTSLSVSPPLAPTPSNLQNPNKTQHHPVVPPAKSPPIPESRSPALSPAQELKHAILPPSPGAYTIAVVPAPGPSGFDGYALTEQPQASPESSPEIETPTGNLKLPGIREVSMLHFAKEQGEEEKTWLDMESSEF